MRQIWDDCDGGILSTELLLVTSVLVAVMASGLTSVRDAVNSEFADVTRSVQNLNQTFMYHGTQSRSARTTGSDYIDRWDPISYSESSCVVFDEAN